ncbi:DUF4236 domain-containing protein [Hymenobacter latericus]|uniref:DUF4236 domain-containing protein n=1 Tax=Hymenobacter sp. YIM 151858-1 TaxID=2987688 RepID=UPI002225FFD7|nr:DUF4236 domain-containing protein [Hymenobacter sp. YIM 151858-1]UYZ58055.1 DUF4236 domain-containing protein [Hymenobacter sp. YIM 151858-1]
MPFSFRKLFNLGPLRLSLTKKGIGVSMGIPGIRVSQQANGSRQVTISVPGTGFTYTKKLGRDKQ